MPVTKSLSKLQKQNGGKGKKVTLHPNGRKFQRLNRATLREEKVANKKRAHNEKRSNELARVKFIQNIINMDMFKEDKTFDLEKIVVFVEQFINRDDDELNELIAKRRSNRPPSNKQLTLQNKKNFELEEFHKGFLVPDLTDEQNVIFLRNWNNTFGALSTFKMIRVNSKGQHVIGGSPVIVKKDVDMEK